MVEKGAFGKRINLAFDYAIMILITLNVIAIILETIPSVKARFAGFFYYFDIIIRAT